MWLVWGSVLFSSAKTPWVKHILFPQSVASNLPLFPYTHTSACWHLVLPKISCPSLLWQMRISKPDFVASPADLSPEGGCGCDHRGLCLAAWVLQETNENLVLNVCLADSFSIYSSLTHHLCFHSTRKQCNVKKKMPFFLSHTKFLTILYFPWAFNWSSIGSWSLWAQTLAVWKEVFFFFIICKIYTISYWFVSVLYYHCSCVLLLTLNKINF